MTRKIIPFKPEHLEVMEMRDHEAKFFTNHQEHVNALNNGMAQTGMYNGRIICCFGISPYFGTIADIWLIPSIYMKDHAVKVAKGTRVWLDEMRQDLNLHRMETVSVNDDLHDRWMTFLGFEKEGIKKKYLNGMDYAMWGRVWE